MTMATATMHPTFAAHAKMQALKCIVVAIMLPDEKFEMCSDELAI
jgi:hypothetical protein